MGVILSRDFHETSGTGKKQTLRLTRRRIIQGGTGLVGLATVAGAGRGLAKTQQPTAPEQSKANPNGGRFVGKVVLITGATSGIGEATARAFAKEGAISPLAVDTPQLRESFAFQKLTYEKAAQGFVTKRVMSPDEMARAVMFLASNEASSTTGMDLDVTGGQLAR